MADFTQIIQEINDDINTNGVGAITGAKLNEVLRDMIAAVNAEKQDPITIDATPTEGSNNPVQSGGVFTALNNLYNALAVAGNCLFGGFVEPDDEPFYGDDHRYYYLAATEGRYTHFYNFEVDSYIAMFLWNENTQHWRMLTLWPNDQTVTEWLENKANIVYGATQGNLAGLDEYGNPTDSGKSPSDFATAAQGTKADTAYQKPSGGIPKTDLASGVQTSLGKADTAFQKPSGGIPASDLSTAVQTSLGKADTAIQDVSGKVDKVQAATAGNIAQFVSGGNLENSGINSDDVFELLELSVSIVDASTPPAIIEPNKVYKYGTLSGNTTFPALETPAYPDAANVYCWTFTTPSTAPTITWPSGITAWAGGNAPTINASKSYEVSVMDGLATIIEA